MPNLDGQLTGTDASLIRIEVKLDSALASQIDHEARLRRIEEHGTATLQDRVSALERWRYALPTAAFLAICSIVGNVIIAVLK